NSKRQHRIQSMIASVRYSDRKRVDVPAMTRGRSPTERTRRRIDRSTTRRRASQTVAQRLRRKIYIQTNRSEAQRVADIDRLTRDCIERRSIVHWIDSYVHRST